MGIFSERFVELFYDSLSKDGSGSAKYFAGFVGWISYIVVLFMSLNENVKSPSDANFMLAIASSLMGLDVLRDLISKK